MQKTQELCIALSSFASTDEARTVGEVLVAEGLVACFSIVSGVTSLYRWNNALEHTPEALCIMKTLEQRLEQLERRLLELHSYELPEFVVLSAHSVSNAYVSWVKAQCDTNYIPPSS